MSKRKAHKFTSVTNGTGSYDWAIYCEYCGLVVFHANHPDVYDRDKQHEKALKGCPLAPDPEVKEYPAPYDPWRQPPQRFASIEDALRPTEVCEHGVSMTDYCEPCGRIHSGSVGGRTSGG